MGASASVQYGATSEEMVHHFINERISTVTRRLCSPKNKSAEEKFSSLHLDRIVSLKSFALRHHSKQHNAYIKPDVVSASFIRQKNTSQRNSSSTGSLKKSSPSLGSLLLDPIAEAKPLTSTEALIKQPKKKFNLKIQINDEDDWIQVSDEEGEEEASPRLRKQTLNHAAAAQQQSYILTQSGTIFVKGFGEGIAKCGIQEEGVDGTHRIPMKERLVILCKLGSGASSVVYKALDIGEMRLVAVKMISVYDRDKRRQMVRELSALFKMLRQRQNDVDAPMHQSLVFERKALHAYLSRSMSSEVPETSSNKIYPHQYIVDFYDAFSNIEDGGVALMMEYMDGGSLQDLADAGGCQDEEVLANIALQVVAGLCALRHCNQIHRDIKPANLLINMLGDVKISDLGILRQIDPLEMAANAAAVVATSATESGTVLVASNAEAANDSGIHRAHTFCGTATYMAPERIDGQDYSYSSDVWSVGLSLLTVALGRMPIESKGGFWSLLSNIRDAPPPELPRDGPWSDDFRKFLSRCLQHDPEKRATAFELLQDPFLSRARPDPPEGYPDKQQAEAAAVKELQDIIIAMHDHILKLKEEQMKSSQANVLVGLAESLTANESTDSVDATQEASSLSAQDILHMLLFGDSSHSVEPNHDGANKVDQFRSLRTPSRLHTLAQQLHINFNLAMATARQTLIDLSSPEVRMRMMATPKAAQRM